MLTQGLVEAELQRLVQAADDVAHDVAACAEAAARAEHAYKIGYARALLRTTGTVAERDAQALLAVEQQHLDRKLAEARLMAAQETASSLLEVFSFRGWSHMPAESFKRKLTAILSADVKGYSRLMGENEAETVRTLPSYRRIMAQLIQQHRGPVIDSPGDNILAEFASEVDAVQCSVAAQNEFKARNAELPENRRMEFRIGLNLGDVIEEEGRIYGDGVNIAARLEALADPGGICISKTAFDPKESKLPLGYQFRGEQTVKNIAKPVGAYKVLMEPRVPPTSTP